MNVPLLSLKEQNLALEEELTAAFQRVLRSGHYILGEEIAAFEKEAARAIGAAHAITVSSGTDALVLALMSLGIGPGDEVLCPSFTFFATAGSVHRVGARPVFVDSCPVCFNLCPESAAARITSRTRALIPVHLFGQAAAMEPILHLARQHGLAVIEDAAQSFGAALGDQPVGTLGQFGAFSFFPSKNLGALGDAGLLTTGSPELADKALLLRTHGSKPKYYHHEVGGNFRMDALQAAFLRVKLPRLEAYTERRAANARTYLEGLANLAGAAQAPHRLCCQGPGAQKAIQQWIREEQVNLVLPGQTRPPSPKNGPGGPLRFGHAWNQFTVRVIGPGRRQALKEHLAAAGIGSEIYYPVPLHRQPCFQHLPPASLPVAEQLAEEVLSLPIYPELSGEQLERVIGALRTFPPPSR